MQKYEIRRADIKFNPLTAKKGDKVDFNDFGGIPTQLVAKSLLPFGLCLLPGTGDKTLSTWWVVEI